MVSVGDRIEVDQPVLELESDRADFELPATVGGVVNSIHVREGQKVKVGQLLLTIEDASQRRRINNEIWLPAEVRFTGSARLLLLKGLRFDITSVYLDYAKFTVETQVKYRKEKDP